MRKRAPRSSEVPADILLTLPDLGIDVEKIVGDEAWASCPGPHYSRVGSEDKHASWSINLETGLHSCFSCSWSGNYARLVRWVFDWKDEPERVNAWIRKHGGIEVVKAKLSGRQAFAKKKAEEITEADLVLFDDPPRWALNDRDYDLGSALAYGVRWNPERMQFGESHRIPDDTWIYPIRDPEDGRLLGWQEKGQGHKHFNNYPKHVEKSLTIFGFELLKGRKEAYVEESPGDCLRLHSYGLDGVVSTYGVHVSDAQIELLADNVDTVFWCLDNDGPGRARTRKIHAEHRHRFKHMFFANYEDIEEKDHGDMDIEDVAWSLDHAISKVRFK